MLRPNGFDVNATSIITYADSTRERNFMAIGGEFYLATDSIHSTLSYDSALVYFDKQTGILETLSG